MTDATYSNASAALTKRIAAELRKHFKRVEVGDQFHNERTIRVPLLTTSLHRRARKCAKESGSFTYYGEPTASVTVTVTRRERYRALSGPDQVKLTSDVHRRSRDTRVYPVRKDGTVNLKRIVEVIMQMRIQAAEDLDANLEHVVAEARADASLFGTLKILKIKVRVRNRTRALKPEDCSATYTDFVHPCGATFHATAHRPGTIGIDVNGVIREQSVWPDEVDEYIRRAYAFEQFCEGLGEDRGDDDG